MAKKRPSSYEKSQSYENSEEYQANVVHELLFVRKGTHHSDPVEVRYFPRIILHGNPKNDPEVLEIGIHHFQTEQNTDNWKDKAEKYEINSYWFG